MCIYSNKKSGETLIQGFLVSSSRSKFQILLTDGLGTVQIKLSYLISQHYIETSFPSCPGTRDCLAVYFIPPPLQQLYEGDLGDTYCTALHPSQTSLLTEVMPSVSLPFDTKFAPLDIYNNHQEQAHQVDQPLGAGRVAPTISGPRVWASAAWQSDNVF